MTHYQTQQSTDGKVYITVFNTTRDGKSYALVLPEGHESHDDARRWAARHGLPILDAQAIYYDAERLFDTTQSASTERTASSV
jgi:hypothetical protein